MKQTIICLLLLILNCCNGQTKETVNNTSEKSVLVNNKKNVNAQIDFLNTKYQKNGFAILDNLTGDLYPSYSYFDKAMGAFSVNYIGKTRNTQYFWDVHNSLGYFSKYKGPDDKEAQEPKNIKKAVHQNDYYIIVNMLPQKYIMNINKQSGEFEIKDNAKTSIYLYVENTWVKLGEFETNKIPERNFQYYIKLIQNYKKNNISKQFQGNFSISVDTEETTTGMASMSYHFNISEKEVNLSINTYHEPIICEGAYIGNLQDNILRLFYVGDDMNCVSVEPRFNIKFEKNKYYIKGVGGEGTNNQWLLMNNGNAIK